MGGIQLHLGKIARDGDRRRQDARRDAAAVSECAARQGRAPRDGELVPRPPRLAVDGSPLQLPRPHRRLPRRHRAGDAGAPRRVSRATSRTARTTSSASTICATTWSSSLDQRVQRAARVRDRRRSGLGAHRRGADAAHHLRARSATRTTRCTSSTTPPSRGSCGGRRSSSTRSSARRERDAREGRHRRRRRCKLYKAQLGGPKNKRLLKVLQEPGDKQLVQKMELEHIADRKLPASKQQFRDIEEDLLFVLDEKGHSRAPHGSGRRLHVARRSRGVRAARHLARRFTGSSTIPTCRAEEKLAARRELELEYATKSERLQHRASAAARARAVREGRELRRAGRRGADRRRVHRPHDAGPPLVGRVCTRRSRRRKAFR